MDLPEAIDKIRPVVLQFSVEPKGTNEPRPFGSGFVLDKLGHIATAAHVVRDAERLVTEGHQVTIGFAFENFENKDLGTAKLTLTNAFYHIGAVPLAVDDTNDVAVLRMTPNLFDDPPPSLFKFGDAPSPVPLCEPCCTSHDRPRDGELVAVSGYPLSSPTLITTAGNLASGWASQTCRIQNGTEVTTVNANVYLADISVNPGNSGGPAYRLQDGCVIGVCSAYRTAPLMFMDSKGGQALIDARPVGINSGLCVVAPISNVANLLAQVLKSSEDGIDAT